MNTRGFAVRSAASQQRGFSLVEVLISIIILSFGMLGMVGMQAAALQSNREARLQSVAYGLAQELADLMRTNQDVALQTAGNPFLVSLSAPLTPGTASYCLAVSGSGCSGATPADKTTLAQSLMTDWLWRVNAELPGARVVVCADTAPFDSSGLPQWNCSGAAPGGAITSVPRFVKIGWTQSSTNRAAAAASALIRTSDSASRPALVFPVIAGSTAS